jgi:hypothetical protein
MKTTTRKRLQEIILANPDKKFIIVSGRACGKTNFFKELAMAKEKLSIASKEAVTAFKQFTDASKRLSDITER